MSRSTPLSNLPNTNKESSNAYDENENTLVKEILQEIDTEKNQKQPEISKEQHQAMMMEQHLQQQAMMEKQQQQQDMMEQQHKQAMMEQQKDVNQHMNEQDIMNNQMEEGTPQQSLSLVDKIMLNIKQPIIVAFIAIIVSIPAVTNMLENMIKSKASLASYATIIILVVKGLISGGLYFGINKSI